MPHTQQTLEKRVTNWPQPLRQQGRRPDRILEGSLTPHRHAAPLLLVLYLLATKYYPSAMCIQSFAVLILKCQFNQLSPQSCSMTPVFFFFFLKKRSGGAMSNIAQIRSEHPRKRTIASSVSPRKGYFNQYDRNGFIHKALEMLK